MAAYYVFGTQVFPGIELPNPNRYSYFRGRLVKDWVWFVLCPHGLENRPANRKQKVFSCRECGQAHYPWSEIRSQTAFAPHDNKVIAAQFSPIAEVITFREEGQTTPGKYLAGLPGNSTGERSVVIWRTIVPSDIRAEMQALGTVVQRSIVTYHKDSGTFNILEVIATIAPGKGMVLSTGDYRMVMTLKATGLDFSTARKVGNTVES